jgi:4-methyl-5(b-hydroxyethyl)-thiazole monophosphate biosynthesis
MSKIAVLCVDGVEEIECLTVVDFCRRAGIEVVTASVMGQRQVMGSHQIPFEADTLFEELDVSGFDAIVYPGGPGTGALGEVPGVKELAVTYLKEGKLVAAICAAPGMLSETGILKGKTATGYPGCKPEGGACWSENLVETDGNLITGKGPGAASAFAIEIIRYLEGAKKAEEIQNSTFVSL